MAGLEKYEYYRDESGVVYHGDCWKLMQYIDWVDVDLIIADPPYNLDIHSNSGRRNGLTARPTVKIFKRLYDSFNQQKFSPTKLCTGVFRMELYNGYFWCSRKQLGEYIAFAEANEFYYDILTWHKNNPIPFTNYTLLPDTEYGLFIREKGAPFNRNLPRELYRKYWVTPRVNGIPHETPKPLQIFDCHILISSPKGGLVFDPFGGSGTTAVSAKKHGRRFMLIEKEEKNCKTIVERLKQEVLL